MSSPSPFAMTALDQSELPSLSPSAPISASKSSDLFLSTMPPMPRFTRPLDTVLPVRLEIGYIGFLDPAALHAPSGHPDAEEIQHSARGHDPRAHHRVGDAAGGIEDGCDPPSRCADHDRQRHGTGERTRHDRMAGSA